MSKKHVIIGVFATLAVVLGLDTVIGSAFTAPVTADVSVSTETGTSTQPAAQQPIGGTQDEHEALLATTVQIMDVCGAKNSEARGAVMAQQIVRVLMDRKGTQAQREAFVSLVCIESKFDPNAKSAAGAIGLSQVMPHLAQAFADICQLGKVSAADIADPEVNLQLGSCLFFSLLEKFDGNVALALSAYNSGANSKTTKAVANLGSGHVETGWYIAKYFALQEKLRIQNQAKEESAAATSTAR
jgi:hypothetical protein